MTGIRARLRSIPRRKAFGIVAGATLLWLLATADLVSSYVFLLNQFGLPKRWPTNTAAITLRLGDDFLIRLSSPVPRQYDSFNQAARVALNDWTTQTHFAFSTQSVPVGFCVFGDSLNTAQWGDITCTGAFQPTTVAVADTPTDSSGRISETELVFNRASPYNAHDGLILKTRDNRYLQDLHRVALHEFGHSLGLNHTDEAGQQQPSIMHSLVTGVDHLQADDVAGANALYAATPPPASTPIAMCVPRRRRQCLLLSSQYPGMCHDRARGVLHGKYGLAARFQRVSESVWRRPPRLRLQVSARVIATSTTSASTQRTHLDAP